MQVSVTRKKAQDLQADLFVVPVAQGAETSGTLREFSSELRETVTARVTTTGFKAKAGKTLTVQTPRGDLVLVGLGKDRQKETVRRAAAAGREAAQSIRAKQVVLCGGTGAAAARNLVPMIEGFLLAGYRFKKYRSKNEDDAYEGPDALTVAGPGLPPSRPARDAVEWTRTACDAVFFARDLINEMSSVKTPSFLAATAKELARAAGNLSCEVWQGEKLKKEKMNGILAVSAGSNEPGAFIRIIYKPKKKAKAVVAVVGKGITFDSGGLSLKPYKAMEWMKQDMSGAAAVLGLMKAVAVVEPSAEVRAYVAAAENMPGSGAQKPGDVITYRNGTTAEVLNTDAEGRLVLADALCVAAEEKPDCIIDLATLTGACMVALGVRVAGILGNNQALVGALIRQGKETGENLWQLPLVEDYSDDIHSSVADIKNIGSGYGGTVTAALFLRRFVGETRWAHLDIAGPAFAEKRFPYAPRGGTGFGVRTLLSYIASL